MQALQLPKIWQFYFHVSRLSQLMLFKDLNFMDGNLPVKAAKFVSLENFASIITILV